MSLSLSLLGSFEARWEGRSLTFPTRASRALLAYLAVEADRPHPRETLAALLWPDQDQAAALNNLRQTLFRLRTVWRQGGLPTALEVTVHDLEFRSAATHVDVIVFEGLLAECATHRHADLTVCAACLPRLEQAVALYRGDFLDDLVMVDSQPFQEWALLWREQLHTQALAALGALAQASETAGAYGKMRHWAERQLALEPWRESAHGQLMRALAYDGQRGAALAQYETCRRVLAQELGIEPSVELAALAARIRAEDLSPAILTTPLPRHNLPARLTPFVGRQGDLAAVGARLQAPDTRLLTVVGAGGMGKTRLALEVAEAQVDLFPDGVFLISLAPLTSAATLAPTIAATLGLHIEGDSDQAIIQALQPRRILLILDNFEHLLDAARFVVNLLRVAPDVRILATSREQLNVRGEQIYTLSGLDFGSGAARDEAAFSPAVRLFAQAARRAQPTFEVNPVNLLAVLDICRLVRGMPLGLELAAAWVEALSPAEIADEIRQSLDFLAYDWRDAPPRQRSLRAVFDWSWRLLSEAERQALRRLSVFRGGFTREAAQAVAGAPLRVLTGLVRKSLLQWGEAGAGASRYEIHEVLRQFAAEQLDGLPAERRAVEAHHAAYYTAFLSQHERALVGADQSTALQVVNAEIDNVRVAWDWLATHGQSASIGQALEGFSLFYDLRSWRQEADTRLRDAYEQLAHQAEPAGPLPDATRLLLSRLLAWRGRFAQSLGQYEQSDAWLAQSLALLRGLDERRVAAFCRSSQGINANIRGNYAESRRLEQESIQLYSEVGDLSGMADGLNRLGGSYYDMGKFPEARRCWQESYELFSRLGDRSGMARGLNNLGEMARHQGDYTSARQQAEESLALLREIGHGWQSIHPLNNLGMLARFAGDYAEARRLHQECLTIARAIGDQRGIATTLLRLAAVAMDDQEWQAAHDLHAESLSLYRKIGYQRGVAACLTSMGWLAARGEYHPAALRLFAASLEIGRGIDDRLTMGKALSGQGWSLGVLGHAARAEQALGAALDIFSAIQALPDALDVLVLMVGLGMRQPAGEAGGATPPNDDRRALDLLMLAQRHPAAWASTRVWATRLQAELETRLSARDFPASTPSPGG